MSWVDTWGRTAAAVMAALIGTMPPDEAAKAAHDAADALLAEMNRRDTEYREAREQREQRSVEFERAWNTLVDQFGHAWSDCDARERAQDHVKRIFDEHGGDADATITAVMALAEAKGVLA